MPARRAAAVAAAALALAAIWYFWPGGDDAAIRQQLTALADTVNESTSDGLGTVARAASIGAHFTDDVVVDLGQGAAPIRGRETLIGMAARLQPRTAAFTLKFEDIDVDVRPDAGSAEISLTAELMRQGPAQDAQAMDAREFTFGMRKVDGEWLIARVTAIDTIR
jgi:hypothetical protein